MASQTEHITATTVNRILRAIGNGRGNFEVRDTTVRGLSIRVRQRAATWTLRLRLDGKQTIRAIAPLVAFRDPDQVRKLAERGKTLAKEGVDPAAFFESARIEGSGDVEAAEAETIKRSGTVWTWERLRDLFLEDTKKLKRADTYRSYKSVLSQPDFDRLNGKLITQIDASDLRAVREAMIDRGTPTQAKAAVRTAKAAFAWAVEQPESGLKSNPVSDVRTTPRVASSKPDQALNGEDEGNGGRPLTERQLGLLPWELEDCPNAAGRLAAMLLITTLQRRLTVVSALKESFTEDEETGYLVWRIPAAMAKGGRPHEVPLPPLARQAYEGALAISRASSPWLFPQQRKRYATDTRDWHMNERTLSEVFYDVQKPGRRLATPEGSERFSPHDVRSSFISYMRDTFRTPEADLAKILAHSEGKGQTVTSRHYDRAKELELKYELLTRWEERLRTLMDKYAPK
jgi:integrase